MCLPADVPSSCCHHCTHSCGSPVLTAISQSPTAATALSAIHHSPTAAQPPAETMQVSVHHIPGRFGVGNLFLPQAGSLRQGQCTTLSTEIGCRWSPRLGAPAWGLCGMGKNKTGKRQGCGEVRKTKQFCSASHVK